MKFVRRGFLIPAIVLMLVCGVEAQTVKQTIYGEEEQTGLLPAIARHEVLVDRARQIDVCQDGECHTTESQLRVSILLVDGGPSTDVSPRYVLYLSMHNYVEEHAVATSLHRLAFLNEFHSVERKQAGIYELHYTGLNLEGAFGDCFFPELKTVDDARELSVLVRKAERTRFFQDATYADPITVTHTFTACSRN